MPAVDINEFAKSIREGAEHTAAMASIQNRFAPQADLAHEVAMLRRELAALRADLIPPYSDILTGAEVARAYSKLKGSAA